MPGSHSKKDKLKKKIAKIKKKKPFMQRKIEEGDKFFFDKKTGTLSSINESTKEYQDFKAETLSNAEKIKTQRKKRRSVGTAKMRKADQQDINRVKRWNSRTFNKKKELSGPTEPVFKPTANLRNRLAKVRKAMMPPEDPLNWLQHYEEEGFVEKKSKEGYNFPVKQLKDESKAVSTRNYRKKVNPPKLTRPSRTGHGATWKGPGTSAAYTSLEELGKRC